MYKKVKRDRCFLDENGSTMNSVLTMEDQYGGRAQLSVDDNCYVVYLKQVSGAYRPVQWIFDEVHTEMAKLPPPSVMKNKLWLELEVERIERERYGETI